MSDKVVKLEDILSNEESPKKKNKPQKKKKKEKENLPRGQPKSGRPWKTPKNRFSSIIKTKGIKNKSKFEKLLNLKKEINRAKDLTKAIVDKRNEEIEQKKERRRNNLKRQAENRLKSEVVQVIKNSAKIKRMRKKQLRNIEKRDTLNKT